MVMMVALVLLALLGLPDRQVPQVVTVMMVELDLRVPLARQVVRQVLEHQLQALDQ